MKLSVVYRTPLCSQKSRQDVFQYIFAPIALPAPARCRVRNDESSEHSRVLCKQSFSSLTRYIYIDAANKFVSNQIRFSQFKRRSFRAFNTSIYEIVLIIKYNLLIFKENRRGLLSSPHDIDSTLTV